MKTESLKTGALLLSVITNVVLAALCFDANVRAMGFATVWHAFFGKAETPDVQWAPTELPTLTRDVAEVAALGYNCYSGECEVALSQILARPDVFDGVDVSTYGWLSVRFEGVYVAAYREDYEAFGHNVVWLNLTGEQYTVGEYLHGTRVRVRGRYHAGLAGHMSLYSGKLDNVRLYELPDLSKPRKLIRVPAR